MDEKRKAELQKKRSELRKDIAAIEEEIRELNVMRYAKIREYQKVGGELYGRAGTTRRGLRT